MTGERVAGVVLAAGLSSPDGHEQDAARAGRADARAARGLTAIAPGSIPVLVVVGHERDRVQEELMGLRCTPVLNREYARGIPLARSRPASPPSRKRATPPPCCSATCRWCERRWCARWSIAFRAGRAPLAISVYDEVVAPPIVYAPLALRRAVRDRRRRLRQAGGQAAPRTSPRAALAGRDAHRSRLAAGRRARPRPAGRLPDACRAPAARGRARPQAASRSCSRWWSGASPTARRRQGDMAIITADGAYHGWLGGNCTQPTVKREARLALADGKPRLVSLSPDPAARGAAGRHAPSR